MPYYTKYSWAPIYFMVYLLINALFLINLVIGAFYATYRFIINSKTKDYYFTHKKVLKKFIAKHCRLKGNFYM